MKRSTKIIQISGFRGLLTAVFVVACLAAGFIAFPGFTAMKLWNHFSNVYALFPQINLLQGILLWAIIALTCYIANGKKFMISLHRPPELSDEEMKNLMEKIRIQSQARILNSMILKSDEQSVINENENKEQEININDEKIKKEKL